MKQVYAKVEPCPRCGDDVGRLRSSRTGNFYSVTIGSRDDGSAEALCGVADFHQCNPAKRAAFEATKATVKFAGIAKLFRHVTDKNPKRLGVRVTDGNVTVEFSYRSHKKHLIQVTDGGPYGDNRWFGSIMLEDGSFRPGRSVTTVPEDRLIEMFDNDPVATAVASARITGACSFCSLPLKDERSVEVGYGPVCAEKYNLPWGNARKYAEPLYAVAR